MSPGRGVGGESSEEDKRSELSIGPGTASPPDLNLSHWDSQFWLIMYQCCPGEISAESSAASSDDSFRLLRSSSWDCFSHSKHGSRSFTPANFEYGVFEFSRIFTRCSSVIPGLSPI